jgi:surface antigen
VADVGTRRVYRGLAAWGEAARGSAGRVALVVALATGAGACSFPVPSLVSAAETTGSISPKVVSPLSAELGAEDWRRAKGAMAVALDPQGSGSPVSWDNPDSGFKGTFTPVGQPFVKGDEICRAFLAGLSGQATSSSLQGTACRLSGEDWAIKDVKPWRRPA